MPNSSMCRVFLTVATLLSLVLSLSLPIHAQSRDNVELVGIPQRVPATGTLTLNVVYVATGNRVLVADVQLKANAATKFGRGSVAVNPGTGTSTIPVTLVNNPPPSNTAYVISLWEVDTNTFNNGNNPNAFAANTANTQYPVMLGTPSTAPAGTTAPPTTKAPNNTPGATTTKPNTVSTTVPTTLPPMIIIEDPTLPPDMIDLPLDPTTDPSTLNPTPDPAAADGDRICDVKNSDQMVCSGCGYTVCRNFVALYQTCAVGSCNSLTQQCDATLPTCTAGPPSRRNDGPAAASPETLSWVMLMLLGVAGSWTRG